MNDQDVELCINNVPAGVKLIALSGTGDIGKTTTLQKVIRCVDAHEKSLELLFVDDRPALEEIRKNGFAQSPRRRKEASVQDLLVIYRVKTTKGEATVGIYTGGDTRENLVDAFRKFQEKDCNIYVCACHTYGKTLDFIKKVGEKGTYTIHQCWSIEGNGDFEFLRNKAKTIQAQELCEEILATL